MSNRIQNAYTLLLPKDRLRLGFLFLLMIIAALIEVAAVAAIPLLVSSISNPNELLNHDFFSGLFLFLGINDSKTLLTFTAFLVAGAFILKNIFLIGYKYLASAYVFAIYTSLGDRLFSAYLKTSYEFLLHRNSAELLRNVTQDTQLFTLKVVYPFLKLIMDACVVIGIIALFLFADPMLTLISAGVLGSSALILMYGLKNTISKFGKQEQTYRARVIQTVNETLSGIREIKVAGKTAFFRDSFLIKLKKTAHAYRFKEFIGQAIVPGIETIAVLGLVVLTLIMTLQGKTLEAIIPMLSLFIAGTARLMPAIKKVVHHYSVVSYHAYVIDSVSGDLTAAYATPDLPKTSEHEMALDFCNQLKFEQVSYTYPNMNHSVFDAINLTIKKGSVVAISGISGSGKSTLVQLLLGFLKPNQGRILCDENDTSIHLDAWRSIVGYIPQEIFLMDGSILENITLGEKPEEIDNTHLTKVIALSQLEGWISTLPDGIHSKTGERGLRISGGQRQRIGLARALYQNPKILVLDEATSALDSATEEAFMNQLLELKGEMTIIMITHKEALLQYADNIFMMDECQV